MILPLSKCPRCGSDKIVVEGLEYYCIKCFYHLNGTERRAFRKYCKKNKISLDSLFPKNAILLPNELAKQLRQQQRFSAELCHGRRKKYSKVQVFKK